MAAERSQTPLRALATSTLSGSAYGFAAVVLAHPFDTVKTLQQTHGGYRSLQHRPLEAAAAVVRSEGVRGFYRGFLPAVGGSMLFRALPFVAYNATSERLHAMGVLSEWPAAVAAVAGASGGLLRTAVESPLEVAKVRRQVGRPMRWGQLNDLVSGLTITAARNTSVIALFWTLYHVSAETRARIVRVGCGEGTAVAQGVQAFLGGAGCSTAAWAVVYPLDVVKARCQSDGAFAVQCRGVAPVEGAPAAALPPRPPLGGGAAVHCVQPPSLPCAGHCNLDPPSPGGNSTSVNRTGVQGHGAPLQEAWNGRMSGCSGGGTMGVQTGIVEAVRGIYRAHGWRGFYAGLTAGLTRSVVANGGAMVVYDAVKRWLDEG